MNEYERTQFLAAIEPLAIQTCLQFSVPFAFPYTRWQTDLAPPRWDAGNVCYDLVFFDRFTDYRVLTAAYKQFAPLARKAIAFNHIVGMAGYRSMAKVWTEIAYEPRLDYGEDLMLKDGYYEVIDGSDMCEGIGWYEVR